MNSAVPRRRQPWGAVLSSAPWDGRPVTPEPLRIPATAASPVLGIETPLPMSYRRQAFGKMLAAANWKGIPKVIVATPVQAVIVPEFAPNELLLPLEVLG